mgnify:CR=1 FL=1
MENLDFNQPVTEMSKYMVIVLLIINEIYMAKHGPYLRGLFVRKNRLNQTV